MDGETRIVKCSECGKKVRIKDNVEKWACPECGTINVNDDYIPEVDDINLEEQNLGNKSNTGSNGKADAYAWVALGLGVGSLVSSFISIPVGVVLAIVALILAGVSYKTSGKNTIAKIGKVCGIVSIAMVIITTIASMLVAKYAYDMINDIPNISSRVESMFDNTKNESKSATGEGTSTLETFSVRDGKYAKGSTVIAKSAIETGSEVIYRGTELEFVGELQDGSAVIKYGGKTYKVGYDCIKAK